MAAVLFALFAAPIFLVVRERAVSDYRFRIADALGSWKQLGQTIRDAGEVPGLRRFLVGRFFYTDPVNTVIVVMSVFATEAIGLTKAPGEHRPALPHDRRRRRLARLGLRASSGSGRSGRS